LFCSIKLPNIGDAHTNSILVILAICESVVFQSGLEFLKKSSFHQDLP
jgi:hypothetical protein